MDYPIYLVNCSRESTQIQLPIWLSVLVSALKIHNIEPHVINQDPVDIQKRERFFKKMIPTEPAIIGFSITAGNNHINIVEKFAKIALEINPNHVIIYGGALPSSAPNLLMENCVCDYIIGGEGELSLPALIHSIRGGNFYPTDIPGLYYKKNGNVVENKPSRMAVSPKKVNGGYQLTELSKPDYSLLDMDFYIDYLKETGQSFEIMASRGCRRNCSFCHRLIKEVQCKTPDAVLDEISEIIDKYGLNRFYFVDENFIGMKPFFKEFVEKKQDRGLDFTYRGQCRIDDFDEDICSWGHDSGLCHVSMGIESVNQDTLNRMNKGLKINDVKGKIELLRRYGIITSFNFILGFPEDTEDDYIAMIDFIKQNKLQNQGRLSCLCPTPGTKLWKECVENGQIKNEWEFLKGLGNLFYDRMINLTNLPDKVLDHYFNEITTLLQRPVSYPKSKKYLEKISSLY